MSIVLRYFDKSAKSVNERFIGFFQPDGLDAQSLVHYMTTALNDHNISFEKCIAQSYDGTSLMSGDIGGVRKKIQEITLHAIYVHYYTLRIM